MFSISLIERKIGQIESRVIALETLESEDLDWIAELPGDMTEEIYSQSRNHDLVPKIDRGNVCIDTSRVLLVKKGILLWTIMAGNLKRRPNLVQLASWLNETPHTHKGMLMIVEREIHDKQEKHVGPEILFGESLEEAMDDVTTGSLSKNHPLEETAQEQIGHMTDQDLMALFEDVEIPGGLVISDEAIDNMVETAFSPMEEVEFEILLTEVV